MMKHTLPDALRFDGWLLRLLRFAGTLLPAIMLSGCALLLTGTEKEVGVDAPDDLDLRISRLADSVWVAEPITHTRPRAPMYIELPAKGIQTLLLSHRHGHDTIRLSPRFNASYLILDLFGGGLLAIAIDGATGAWNDFGGTTIHYAGDDSTGAPLWELRRRKPLGVIISGYWGAQHPVQQVPIPGNHVGFGLGYQFTESLQLLAGREYAGCTELVDYRGELRPSWLCDLTTSSWTLTTRFYPLKALPPLSEGALFTDIYAIGGGALHTVCGDTANDPDYNRIPYSYSQTVPGVFIGFGIGSTIFAEYRWSYGFERVQFAPGSDGALRFTNLRFGFNVKF